MDATLAPTGYASVNGLELYYEIHGSGQPTVLLHGGLGSSGMFAHFLPALAADRQVIAVDLQAAGHTADIDRPMTYEALADDVAALIAQLGITSADVIGYSLGGGVALQTAIRHSKLVRRLVLLSTPYKRQGWYPEVLAGMAAMNADNANQMAGTPWYDTYKAIAPRPDDWPIFVGKTADLLRTDYDWTPAVAALKLPVLIVIGDADSLPPSHATALFELLGGGKADGLVAGLPASRFAILPAATHFDTFDDAERLIPLVVPFLDAPQPAAKQATREDRMLIPATVRRS